MAKNAVSVINREYKEKLKRFKFLIKLLYVINRKGYKEREKKRENASNDHRRDS